ncbi:aminoglycoside phosphotransferase family protein [Thiothrix subterranea]|uniref:aminoglycoside phosphotransferase family protein n=1 Tax=Thiothrix subterranea TaxID=2735563 RepID=UPI00280A8EB0|nr:phosphotransferase [Thiothrix subterranea]
MTQDTRLEQLTQWVNSLPNWEHAVLEPASADASFRRYFRARGTDGTAICMDAPPDKEDIRPFVEVTHLLSATGVHAPQLLAQNLLDGFLLLEDLGNTSYLSQLTPETAKDLYADALHALLQLQQADCDHLPAYNERTLRREMELMPEWFLKTHLGFSDEQIPHELIQQTFEDLIESAIGQPVAFVHRDYHSRNLMVTPDNNPGIIDYQDAVLGPATYDLVSLLRDCYIVWPQAQVEWWVDCYRKEAIAAGCYPQWISKPTSNGLISWGCNATLRYWGFLPVLITVTANRATSTTCRWY